MALPQLPAYVVHKLGQHSRVIQEFLSTENMQKRAADTSGSFCVACSTDLQERVIFLWGPLKFSIFGESGGTSRPMSPATFFATLLPNARVPLLLAKRNARFCFNSNVRSFLALGRYPSILLVPLAFFINFRLPFPCLDCAPRTHF